MLNASIAHPAFGESLRPSRGFYRKPTGTYIISAPPPDYAAWAKPDWNSRIRLVVETLHAVVGRIPKTRLDANERSVLHGLLDKAAELAAIRPPARIARVLPIYRFSSGAISFQPFEQPPPGGIAIFPAEADAFARECRHATASEFTGPLKLYRRVDGALHYREIWASGRVAIEHWGKCGERGEMSERSLAPDETVKGALDEFAVRTRKLNYRAIPRSRHKIIVVEYPIDGFGSLDDLEQRHAIEEHLDQLLGWHGLGSVDGGSTGSGTMEVACPVVSLRLARQLIERELASSRFGKPQRVYVGGSL